MLSALQQNVYWRGRTYVTTSVGLMSCSVPSESVLKLAEVMGKFQLMVPEI